MKFSITFIFIIFSLGFFSQTFSEKNFSFSAGIGMLNSHEITLFNDYKDYPNFSKNSNGNFHLKMDYGFSEEVSLGIRINYNSGVSSLKSVDSNTNRFGVFVENNGDLFWKYKTLEVLFRINKYKKINNYFELFYGAGFGYAYHSDNIYLTPTNSDEHKVEYKANEKARGELSFIALELSAGGKLYFTKNLGVYIEVGWTTNSIIQGGIVYNIK